MRFCADHNQTFAMTGVCSKCAAGEARTHVSIDRNFWRKCVAKTCTKHDGFLTSGGEWIECEFEQPEGRQLACTEPVESPDTRIERLSKKASDALGTPYSVFIERDICRREYEMVTRCKSCRMYWQSWFAEDELEANPKYCDDALDRVVENVRQLRSHFANEKRICMCVEGKTPSRLLALYEGNQRVDMPWAWAPNGGFMTARQREAARSAWSSSLRAKQAEAREKERCQVVCDEQWGEDV